MKYLARGQVSTLSGLVLVFGLLAGPVSAAPGNSVEATVIHAVQSPAWIQSAAERIPARPGYIMRDGDRLLTGRGGRAQVDLPEGSRVKLGEETDFRTSRLVEREDEEGGFFSAALDVLKGAFRFTTGLAGQERRRSVDIKVGVLTAGIRGTDLWGRSGDDGDFVVLLEGRIEMATSGMAPDILTEPLDGRIVPKGQDQMQSMPDVTMDVVQQLAPQTELDPDRGALQVGGKLQLVLASSRYPRGVEAIQARLAEAGYPAYIEAVPINDTMWHRVVIDHLPDVANAQKLGESLVGEYGVNGYWVNQQR